MIKPVSCSRGKHALGAETRTSGTVVCFTVEFVSSLLTPSTPELSTVSTIYKMYTVRAMDQHKVYQRYARPAVFPRCVSSAPLKSAVEFKTGSCQEPATGTHRCPCSATAIGGIILYCTGAQKPVQCIEKNEIPLESMPAMWPNVLHPINRPSAWIMQDKALCTSGSRWRKIGIPITSKVPGRIGLH